MKHFRSSSQKRPLRQRGAVLLFSLIALTLLLISAVAMVRSFNGSMFTAGNVAFKRDLLNQGERAVKPVLDAVQTGPLATAAVRAYALPSSNYSATILDTNDHGIPNVLLLDDSGFNAFGRTSNDISGAAGQQVSIRYVIDRLCKDEGPDNLLGASKCTQADSGTPPGGSASELLRAEDTSSGGAGAVPHQVVYRLSIRVNGPRGTQAFYQTTFGL